MRRPLRPMSRGRQEGEESHARQQGVRLRRPSHHVGVRVEVQLQHDLHGLVLWVPDRPPVGHLPQEGTVAVAALRLQTDQTEPRRIIHHSPR